MKHFLLSTLAITTLTFSAACASDDDYDDDDERVRHFEVVEPKSWAQAIEIIETKGAEMKAAYAAKDYDKMHELSYSLEVAADYLDEEAEDLMEALEEVHHATEDEQMDALDQKFPELETRLNAITGQ